ncbi:helix-turn-helix domain-containing protein, partial [Secundilactobacillus pentosiphilus]|uniref:helix-turn-helix domain-containing protein n=1 Tax=Secundilactobacillus pentosiphilus TaxID=1714682 RepID=UPI001179F6C3
GLSTSRLNNRQYYQKYGISLTVFSSWVHLYKSGGLEALQERHKWTRYSQQTKEEAVLAYLNGEGSLIDISEKFGLRSKTQLRNWIRKFTYNETNQTLTATPSRKKVSVMGRKTTFEERIEIVEYVVKDNHSYNQAAEKYQVSYQQVRSWVIKSKSSGYPALKDRRGRTKPETEMTEIERLKLENRQLKAQLKEQEVMKLFAKKLQELKNKE